MNSSDERKAKRPIGGTRSILVIIALLVAIVALIALVQGSRHFELRPASGTAGAMSQAAAPPADTRR